jgi:hypothetical protein
MAAPNLAPINADLDFLLAEVALALQLTPDQYAVAVKHYRTIAEWLAASGSSVARFKPTIYPQGSMALETTVRPRKREEYDLDFVCQMMATGLSAMEVFQLVLARIREHGTYAPMLKPMNRCIRIDYAHNFHMDIIPAEPDLKRGGTAIVVPDRKLETWTPSNPQGYVSWFRERTVIALPGLRKAMAPLPGPTPSDEKPNLTIAVQLMKRRRDMLCDDETAPRSVVLTTLAGEYYAGGDVFTALVRIVAGIQQRIAAAHPKRIVVCNPTNSDERFCESFEGPGRYDAFKWYVNQLQRDLERIVAAHGIPELQKILSETFGEEPVSKAVRSYGERLKKQRDEGSLKFSGAGAGALGVVTPASNMRHTAPTHNYFGGDTET